LFILNLLSTTCGCTFCLVMIFDPTHFML
jgi:hypothetical protein